MSKRIRIGKDISLRWAILTDGAAIPLEGRDLLVEIKSPYSVVSSIPFRVDGNVLIMTYYGYKQKYVGEYSLTLWENKGKPGQNVVDAIRAFKLVRTSPEEEDFTGGDLQVESVDLGTANLEILSGGGAATPGESPDLSALEGKVAANTANISKINAELDTVKEVQDGHNNSIAQISTTVQEIKTDQTEQNNRLADHEERLVYTEGDLEKVREEYNGIISELMKSIGHLKKTFEVTTNSYDGYIYIDGVKEELPKYSSNSFRFNNTFGSGDDENPGISSFRFLFTDTSEITSMAGFFKNCSSLNFIDVSNFDTSKVSDMSYMFSKCSSLRYIDVSNFDTSNVTNVHAMFNSCYGLRSIDLSNFNTSEMTDLSALFYHCTNLTSIDISNFDTSKATTIGYMFEKCSSLTSIDLSNFDTSTTTNMVGLFDYCTALTSLLLGPNFFKTSAVTSIDFSPCPQWTNETVVTSLVTNSYDRAAAGLNTLTLKLHANTKAALTDEQKATITAKGYTIA